MIYHLPPRDNILHLTPVMMEAEENVNSHFQRPFRGREGKKTKKKNPNNLAIGCSWELARTNNGKLLTVSVLPKVRGP